MIQPILTRCAFLIILMSAPLCLAQIPHGQSKPPNKPYSATDAAKRMTVPDGFTVEVVAAEPDLVNPVAMTFDEKGRIWVTESLEYPRRSSGKGKDRIKILEDPDGDGRYDKVTIFADDLNIPSGIAVGHGGVWVANAPDLLFMQDTDGDGKCDRRKVVVSGFGRTDTHELPNSLTWGPDGCLYGWNGVFNFSHVKQDGKDFRFTCAIFRINPRNRKFDLFCEGTSNPWGIAWNPDGEAFASACVIDHLWHLSETGYYHRQGGPYPPYTWKIESIVDYKHQKAAYCGIHYFDSDAYPEPYRDKLYMGNIHGNCINVDGIDRRGATYRGKAYDDFLSANDAWFMPVVQKTGPDGCLYILDWYDRYHCYQDANRDPKGIDRLKGRLYRVRYRNTPRAKPFDLSSESDAQLVKRLFSKNVFYRDLAQRVLCERNSPQSRPLLLDVVKGEATPYKTRLHAFWSLLGMGMESVASADNRISPRGRFFVEADAIEAICKLKVHSEAERDVLRSWALRAVDLMASPKQMAQSKALGVDPIALKESIEAANSFGSIHFHYDRQLAIGSRHYPLPQSMKRLTTALKSSGKDPLVARLVWQNLLPWIERHPSKVVDHLVQSSAANQVQALIPRLVDRIIDIRELPPSTLLKLFVVIDLDSPSGVVAARKTLRAVANRIESGEMGAERKKAVAETFLPTLGDVYGDSNHQLRFDAAFLSLLLNDSNASKVVLSAFASNQEDEFKIRALAALAQTDEPAFLKALTSILDQKGFADRSFQARAIATASNSKFESGHLFLVKRIPMLHDALVPATLELATSRVPSARELMKLIQTKQLAASRLSANQIRKLFSMNDAELKTMVTQTWGKVRTERDPKREQVISDMRKLLRETPGDPSRGEPIFMKVCGQCHKLHGAGFEVGPDITNNGRNSFEQLLSNVFDPSLVIGSSYQARLIETVDGRTETGLLLEDNDRRVVLNTQGGKKVTFPREQIERIKVSKLSMMPEDLEKTLKRQELADLFAFITLDKHPAEPLAKPIPGALDGRPRQSKKPQDFPHLVGSVLYRFETDRSGLDGVSILKSHLGRNSVLRVHPISEKVPTVLRRSVTLPKSDKLRLILSVSHHQENRFVGDWKLLVKANGEKLIEKMVNQSSSKQGWLDLEIDLSKYSGKQVLLELENHANNWYFEYGYFHRAEIIEK